jgi:hypothetical protein
MGRTPPEVNAPPYFCLVGRRALAAIFIALIVFIFVASVASPAAG